MDPIEWLMEGDPAVRWQTMRDLLDAPEPDWKAEREKVALEGWGATLLAAQDPEGTWGGGIYTPKWTSTTYTLLLLLDFGLPGHVKAARLGAQIILDRSRIADAKGLSDLDTCIAGMWLRIGCAFGCEDPKLETLADHVLEQQMPDGGWNCRRKRGDKHSSFHTTFNVLDGVREAIARGIRAPELQEAESRAIEFMLQHRLFRSDKTGKIINPKFLEFAFPCRWHYDVLRGLDYIRTTRFVTDERLSDALELVNSKRRPDGRWPIDRIYSGVQPFRLDSGREGSRFNTLRALRCLKARITHEGASRLHSSAH